MLLSMKFRPLKIISNPLIIIEKQNHRRLPLSLLLMAAILFLSNKTFSQEKKDTIPDGTEGVILVKHPQDSISKKLPPNEFNGPLSTFKIGLGLIVDYAAFSQDEVFKEQMDSANLVMESKAQVRDFRILGSGVLKTKRTIAWKFAYMYDAEDKVWMLRESGVTIGVPELAGHIFIGRTKEGYSEVQCLILVLILV